MNLLLGATNTAPRVIVARLPTVVWCVTAVATALTSTRRGVRTPSLPALRSTEVAAAEDLGLHGSQSCFMPVAQLDDTSRWPRLLRVAGMYPGLSSADVAAPPQCEPPADPGKWNYEFPDEHGSEYGVVRRARVRRSFPPVARGKSVRPCSVKDLQYEPCNSL